MRAVSRNGGPAGQTLRSELTLVRVGNFDPDLFDELAEATGIRTGAPRVDPSVAFNPSRGQYDSTRLVAELRARYPETRVVGAAACDLFIPVLTFVFGEAEMPGRAAIFSTHRLREEFYGLPPDHDLLLSRAVRELWHEVGHLFGLTHCWDWSCVMSSSHSVERVDAKGDWYCAECEGRVAAQAAGA